jgi:hypothetical protein
MDKVSPGKPEMRTMSREDLIADTFVGIVDSLVDEFDIIDMLTGLTLGCVDLDLATASGILLADDHGKLRVMAASSERAHLLELFQLQNDEGPCLEAFSTGEPVVHVDLSAAFDRWPRFAPEAVRGRLSLGACPSAAFADISDWCDESLLRQAR